MPKNGICSTKLPYILFVIYVLFIIIFSGCATKKEPVSPVSNDIPYSKVVKQLTREGRVYNGLELRLTIYATYKSWSLREAYLREYASAYKLDSDKIKLLTEKYRAIDAKMNEFFLAVTTLDPQWNDLAKNHSIWRVYLENGRGERVDPLKIKRINEKDPAIRELYPRLDHWNFGYVASFPKYSTEGKVPFLEDTKSFKLVITGSLGKSEIEWTTE